ncbi:MAG: hypothetical protein HN341_02735 [Verrucomicrobia bacterium]|jgi:hypothetical protein|nr:hypothetical protein [Verrucomicrobiota bacterium]
MDQNEWRGCACQQFAVLASIHKPMACRDIHAAAVELNPHIRLRDVGQLIRQLIERGYVRCIIRQPVTGSLYYLTLKGRQHLEQQANIRRAGCPRGIDWELYAKVSRGRTRTAVLMALQRLQLKTGEPQTVGKIRRELIRHHPITLNATIRAMNELCPWTIGFHATINPGNLSRQLPASSEKRFALREVAGKNIVTEFVCGAIEDEKAFGRL